MEPLYQWYVDGEQTIQIVQRRFLTTHVMSWFERAKGVVAMRVKSITLTSESYQPHIPICEVYFLYLPLIVNLIAKNKREQSDWCDTNLFYLNNKDNFAVT